MSLISFSILNGMLSMLAIAGFIAVLIAFRARREYVSDTTLWFIAAFTILALALILRATYWDFIMPIFRYWYPVSAYEWRMFTGGRAVNVIFHIMSLLTIYCALKCRQSMIPEDEQHLWPWYLAWKHPTPVSFWFWRSR